MLDKNLTSKLIDETEQERILRRARISEILGSVRDGKKSTNGVDTSTNNSISSPKVNSEGIIEVDHGHEELPNIQTQY